MYKTQNDTCTTHAHVSEEIRVDCQFCCDYYESCSIYLRSVSSITLSLTVALQRRDAPRRVMQGPQHLGFFVAYTRGHWRRSHANSTCAFLRGETFSGLLPPRAAPRSLPHGCTAEGTSRGDAVCVRVHVCVGGACRGCVHACVCLCGCAMLCYAGDGCPDACQATNAAPLVLAARCSPLLAACLDAAWISHAALLKTSNGTLRGPGRFLIRIALIIL